MDAAGKTEMDAHTKRAREIDALQAAFSKFSAALRDSDDLLRAKIRPFASEVENQLAVLRAEHQMFHRAGRRRNRIDAIIAMLLADALEASNIKLTTTSNGPFCLTIKHIRAFVGLPSIATMSDLAALEMERRKSDQSATRNALLFR